MFIKAKRKALYLKLSNFIYPRLEHLIDVEGWQRSEIAQACGIHPARITEIMKPDSYGRGRGGINEIKVQALIDGGFVLKSDLLDFCNLDKDERRYVIKTFKTRKRKAA